MAPHQKFPGVYVLDGRLATKSIAPGFRVYDERVARLDNVEYRLWDIFKSKLAAALAKGMKELPIKPGARVLYLGAASGTTPSHVSDIVGTKGAVFCVEFAPRSMRDLIRVCERRENMLPILADAHRPDAYAREVGANVDCVYEDVAQPDQAEIMISNARAFLPKGGPAMIAIKSQSIDVTAKPSKIYEEVLAKLSVAFEVNETFELSPYDKDHMFARLTYKGNDDEE